MTGKVRIRVALLAALVLSTVAASAASAEYNLTTHPVVALTGEQIEHVVKGEEQNYYEITALGSRTTCTSVEYTGLFEEGSPDHSLVHPTYTGCTTSGFASTFHTTGCDFTLTGETNAQGHGIMHIVCETGKALEMTIPSINCTIKIHAQTPTGGGWTYTNTTGIPADVQATTTLTGITYERVGNGFFCALAAPSEGNDTDLVRKITLKAYENPATGSNQIGLTIG